MRFVILCMLLLLPHAGFAETIKGSHDTSLNLTYIAEFNEPWAIEQLDDQSILLTEKSGQMWRVDDAGHKMPIRGVPKVAYGGQGGLGDIKLHPDFAENRLIYFSAIASNDGGATRGAVVYRAEFTGDALENVQQIWRQDPFVSGMGHFGHKLAFSKDAATDRDVIFITSGDRQYMHPAQNYGTNIGKIVRIFDDGGIPETNPYFNRPPPTNQIWSAGHRNPLGIAFDPSGALWSVELGPADGDELNLIQPARNYGWPIVSEGEHYDGTPIPSHATRPDFTAPIRSWVPTIAPSAIHFMPARDENEWASNAFVTGLKSRALFRLQIVEDHVDVEEIFQFKRRLRDVLPVSDDRIWLIEDGKSARLVIAKKQD